MFLSCMRLCYSSHLYYTKSSAGTMYSHTVEICLMIIENLFLKDLMIKVHDLALYISNEKVIWPIMSGIGF